MVTDHRLGEVEEVCRLGEAKEDVTVFREVGEKEIEDPTDEWIDVSLVSETMTLNSHF